MGMVDQACRLKVPSERNYSAPLFSREEQGGEREKWSNVDTVSCHPFLTLAFTSKGPLGNRVLGFFLNRKEIQALCSLVY